MAVRCLLKQLVLVLKVSVIILWSTGFSVQFLGNRSLIILVTITTLNINLLGSLNHIIEFTPHNTTNIKSTPHNNKSTPHNKLLWNVSSDSKESFCHMP